MQYLYADEDLVIYDKKSMVTGAKSPNALQEGSEYGLEWRAFGSFDSNEAVHIESSGKGHSNRTYIHHLGTTASSSNGGGAYTSGCKGIACENDVQISDDGQDLFSGLPYKYKRQGGVGTDTDYPTTQDRKNSGKAWANSRKAMALLYKLYQANENRLQETDNFKLRILQPSSNEEPPMVPMQADSTESKPVSTDTTQQGNE